MSNRKLVNVSTEELHRQVLDAEFPSNSNKKKEEAESAAEEQKEKKGEKIIKGDVVRNKKSLGQKIKDLLVGDDARSVGAYILYDVLVPAAKSTITDMVKIGIEMMVYGEERPSAGTKRDRDRSYVSYANYYKEGRDRDRSIERVSAGRSRGGHGFAEYTLKTRGDAEDVLESLVDRTIDYGECSIAFYYSQIGVESTYIDEDWGWERLNTAYVERARDRWRIVFPKPIKLD